MEKLFLETARRSINYRQELENRQVPPTPEALESLKRFEEDLPDNPCEALETLRLLDEIGSPASMASAGGRFFGFVIGSSLPVTVAANWLAAAWDQESGQSITAPTCAKLESISAAWLLDLLGLPPECGTGFVTGATMGNFCALAAARHVLLEKEGWNVEEQGLFGAPPINLICGDEVHASVLKALGLLGFGRKRIIRVPVDAQGRMRPELIPTPEGASIICAQVGHVATGACDPLSEICARARKMKAWVHVDGAFGLWARAVPEYAYLLEGLEEADSWVTDGHKWLNVPYDSGLVFVKNEKHLRGAMSISAAYLQPTAEREPDQYAPEMSRRARGVEIWAALHTLGRQGLAKMLRTCCEHAAFFAEGFRNAGFEVLNEVVLNQVLVSFGENELTEKVIKAIQQEGTCWCGGTTWQGKKAMRLSVSSWNTSQVDCQISLEKILEIVKQNKNAVS